MFTIDKNQIGDAASQVCGNLADFVKTCDELGKIAACLKDGFRAPCLDTVLHGPRPKLPSVYELTPMLTACGEEFYIKCPAFDQLERSCDFKPAIEAAQWKEKVQLDRLTQLESQVKELQIALKKKG